MQTLLLKIWQHQQEKSWIEPQAWQTDSFSTAPLLASIKLMPSRLGSLPLSTTHLHLCPWIQLLTWLPLVPSKCIVTTHWWLSTIHQPTLTRLRLKISLVFSIKSSFHNLIWLETSIEMVPVVSSLPMALLFGPKLLSPSSCHSFYLSIYLMDPMSQLGMMEDRLLNIHLPLIVQLTTKRQWLCKDVLEIYKTILRSNFSLTRL